MSFPIVGIGASAGGLEAISELLAALPSRNGMAFVIVQHLGPDHESLLTELLGKRTPMPVAQAAEGIVIEPEHVYVNPPNATLTVSHQRLHLAACCSPALPRRACWSTRRSTSCNSAVRRGHTSSTRAARRA